MPLPCPLARASLPAACEPGAPYCRHATFYAPRPRWFGIAICPPRFLPIPATPAHSSPPSPPAPCPASLRSPLSPPLSSYHVGMLETVCAEVLSRTPAIHARRLLACLPPLVGHARLPAATFEAATRESPFLLPCLPCARTRLLVLLFLHGATSTPRAPSMFAAFESAGERTTMFVTIFMSRPLVCCRLFSCLSCYYAHYEMPYVTMTTIVCIQPRHVVVVSFLLYACLFCSSVYRRHEPLPAAHMPLFLPDAHYSLKEPVFLFAVLHRSDAHATMTTPVSTEC